MKLNFFNFKKLNDRFLLTNDFGKYMFLDERGFKKLLQKQIDVESEIGRTLIDKKIIYTDSDLDFTSQNRYLLREYKHYMNLSTSLHIFVVTTSCNMSCVYCQANNGEKCSDLYMNYEIAENAVDIALQSPTKYLTFEFQGGEPLLNFDVMKHIVEYAECKKGNHIIEYNIVSNLTLIADEIINFFVQYKFGVSTSLDGSKALHNINRPFKGGGETYDKVSQAIAKLRDNNIHVGAIETTSVYSFDYSKEIIDTYKNMGFDSIFIRPLTPLGKATRGWDKIGYDPEKFVEFYKKTFKYLLQINKGGYYLKEVHASLLLNKIFGGSVNYMDLRSPCGAGVGQLAYYSDGNIFTCDEGRMLYEMGDDTFCLGNVFNCSYNDLVSSGICKTVCVSSVLESIPSCTDCVYQPYCGTCPVVNYALEKDVIEKYPRGYRCRIYSGILDCIFDILKEEDADDISILKSWI